jgi:hypothetical protein
MTERFTTSQHTIVATRREEFMGWRGVLRDLQASSRRMERDAYRQRRALEKQHQQLERMEEVQRAAYEVELHENLIELLVSVHKECGAEWDWNAVWTAPPPAVPQRLEDNERDARDALDDYSPGMMDRLLGRVDSKRAELEAGVEDARQLDKENFRAAVDEYKTAKADWESSRKFAARILKGDLEAYKEAMRETNPFGELAVVGSSIEFVFPNAEIIQADVHVNGDRVIPSEIKSQSKAGKLSIKAMPKGRSNEIYQAYVCGCVFRVARELFALLPVKMVIVNALGRILNTQTGHLEEKAVLSVAVPRDTIGRIRWESIDPADAMSNFVHRMCFKKSKGLFAVEPIQMSELRK